MTIVSVSLYRQKGRFSRLIANKVQFKALAMNFIAPLAFILHVVAIDGAKEKNFCGVCRAVVEEANWRIGQADPKRTIQVGSFRVDPQGNQNIKEKNYARSESHVEEIFESVCDELKNYAMLNQNDGLSSVVRTKGRQGQQLQTSNLNLDMGSGKKLNYLCLDFLESHEEEVMALLQKETVENYEQVICGDETNVCSEKDFSSPLMQLPEEVEAQAPEPSEEDIDDNAENQDGETAEGDALANDFENLMGQEGKEEL